MKKSEAQKYLEGVLSGEIVACKKIKQLAEMMLPRFEDGYKEWHFDIDKANRPVEFIERFCKLTSGKPNTPFVLEDYEKMVVQIAFGFVDDNGFRQFQEILVIWARKNGKALDLDTPIPTPSGYKQMRDIHPGDLVFGSNGEPVEVLVESEIFNKAMYRVVFEDGDVVNASEDHVWTVQTKSSRRVARRTESKRKRPTFERLHGNANFEITTKDMARDFKRVRADGKGTEYKYRVPMNKAIQRDEARLPIDPYVLGVWLGDGYSSDNVICVGRQDICEMLELLGDQNPQPKLEKTAYSVRLGNKHTDSKGYMHNDFKDALKSLGLINNKHIPREYLMASEGQRLALLQGLMDTDGSITKRGQCTFSQKDTRMLDDMLELLSGLGLKATYRQKVIAVGGGTCSAYEIQFFAAKSTPCFRLKRKLERQKGSLSDRMLHKSIVSIEPIPNRPSKCIAVDSADHLFLCGKRYTTTHNTELGAAIQLYMLVADGEFSPQVYNVANSKDQASLAYGACLKMIRQSRELSRKLRKGIVPDRNQDGILNDLNMGYITPLSSQTRNLDGLNTHFALIDEMAACVNRDIYDLVKQSISARDQPMLLEITTNGFERGNLFDTQYDYAAGILEGTIQDDRFLPIIFELDDRDEWEDERCWKKANPGLGVVKKLSYLKDQVNKAMQDASYLPTVLTKDFNVPENRAVAWLDFESAVNEEPFELEHGQFRYGIAGFDASDTTDLSAACMLMMRPGDDRIYKKSMYWIPEDSLALSSGYRKERDDVPYTLWEKRGLLRIVPGNKVPKSVFIEWLEEMKREYDVWTYAIGYDPWHVVGTDEDNLKDYVGDDLCEVIRQGPKTLSDPMKQIAAEFRANRIVDGHNPIDEWCRMNVSVKSDVNANIQPVKVDGKAKNRIDGFMAELCAYIALLRHSEEYANVI